jgi:hypothetical protein
MEVLSKSHFFGGGPLDGQTREDIPNIPELLVAEEPPLISYFEPPSEVVPGTFSVHIYREAGCFHIGAQRIRAYRYGGLN